MRLSPLLAALPLAACMTTTPDDARQLSYACDRGTNLTVIYSGEIARIESDGPPINLQKIGSGADVVYSSATRKIRGEEGGDITYAVGRAAPETCQVVAPAG